MSKAGIFLLMAIILGFNDVSGQYRNDLKLDIPLFGFPENAELPYGYPSMNQALGWSSSLYELGFHGISVLGDKIFIPDEQSYKGWRKICNNIFKYASGSAFSLYGSELPLPLGVWSHEEFHRSVLGITGISSKNGNWIFNRWNGTVYGISDISLSDLKASDPRYLLYSYVSGIQYEVLLTENITLDEFSNPRSYPRSALILYNSWYVYKCFRSSTSSISDSPPSNEDPDQLERDFSGLDLTSWVYDMLSPEAPFLARAPFPDGNGVNRRIGFSGLSTDEQDYLKKQKQLSLINFLNPSILLIDRIRINSNFAFNSFGQYMPTHFGNDIAAWLILSFGQPVMLLNVHRYSNYSDHGTGFGMGLSNIYFSPRFSTDFLMNVWDQPESFFGTGKIMGAFGTLTCRYSLNNIFSGYITLSGKTKGWFAGMPNLDDAATARLGFAIRLINRKLPYSNNEEVK